MSYNERNGFWTLEQLQESVDAYLTRLKIKVNSHDYNKEIWPAAIQLEMLHDKFVFGLPDDTLKERLLCETKLTLAKAIEIGDKIRQRSK